MQINKKFGVPNENFKQYTSLSIFLFVSEYCLRRPCLQGGRVTLAPGNPYLRARVTLAPGIPYLRARVTLAPGIPYLRARVTLAPGIPYLSARVNLAPGIP